jgi:hypothetical protein
VQAEGISVGNGLRESAPYEEGHLSAWNHAWAIFISLRQFRADFRELAEGGSYSLKVKERRHQQKYCGQKEVVCTKVSADSWTTLDAKNILLLMK